ncbi:MarR family winged helix-turn-helix transcriptional regulator [Cohnella silvisoli]|uniref:MarR family transcriptional regulator n=1 Tax=Cohnella silvisoli TaxID=2873699 RepID=A0ABV1KPI0_9BACL|nr:MarR family transcriptional regulator [Cohnella silvisoli]MCD9020292.1 MarR family transcriptional regulator [Cohnella silvisoli]
MPLQEDVDVQTSLKLLIVLSKAYKSIMDKAVKDIKNYGLSASEFGIMDVLHKKGKIPIQQIGGKILITSGTMTFNIDKLENKGLIRRIPSTEDRRVIHAEITEAGEELFTRIFPQHASSIHGMMNVLTTDQKLEAIALLKLLGKGAHSYDNET